MTKSHTITISFLPRDEDIWQYVQLKKESSNLSEYIRSLIRKEMNSNDFSSPQPDESIEKILEMLSTLLPSLSFQPANIVEKETVSDETKSTIHSLF
ncbi:hypothetical protein BTO30_00500 [Domibacillus antri]|uniref:Uncharacterized protein n=1 Tax=Domibacillus antri TaxID=1714264 RepID=A0A1Q8Q9K0_9BACI|nr:hypothetical protein [Domibacillus antri]OLN23945.1 hypothetical protein BTO30_00500 [Domibacillus antri]